MDLNNNKKEGFVMRKNIVIFVLITAASCLLFGCKNSQSVNKKQSENGTNEVQSEDETSEVQRMYGDSSMVYIPFDSLLDSADTILEGTVTEITQLKDHDEYKVQVTNCYKGEELTELTVKNYLFNYSFEYDGALKDGSTHIDYETGKSYVFVLQHIDNVYENSYLIESDIFLPVDDEDESISYMSLDIDIDDSIADYMDTYDFSDSQSENETMNYVIDSEDMNDIVLGSKYIVKVKLDYLMRQTDIIDLYMCKVESILKGDDICMDDNTIYIPFACNTVTESNEYIVGLYSDSTDSYIYSLSAKNSVFDVSKENEINSILNGEE